MRNIVYRQCSRCKYEDVDDYFRYLGDGVFACPKCTCKYTEVSRVFDPIKCAHNGTTTDGAYI